MKLLNLACGSKVSPKGNWTNIDFSSPLIGVIETNILKGLNFSDNSFNVVYSAQFIEHLTLEQAESVLKEVNRVLKPGGVLRLVTPDLEELANSYLNALKTLKSRKSTFDINKYNWLRLEIFDQIVRDYSGGEQKPFLSNVNKQMHGYIDERIGHSFNPKINSKNKTQHFNVSDILSLLKKIPKKLLNLTSPLFETKYTKVGKFRQSGEVHRYLHDIYSISNLLSKTSFSSTSRVNPYLSEIPDWQKYELDVVGGKVDAPLSLYVEAKKQS